ncbi:MAG: lipid-A-disaccharide synthase [Pseudobdellovibrio sp.]
MNQNSVMIIAAEASSAHYAAQLMRYWHKNKLSVDIFGVGSAEMESLGQKRIGYSEDMAVVGLAEVVAHYSDLKKVFNNLVAEAIRRKPRFILLMDYPDFNLRLAEKLKIELGQDIKVFYYISPQVWAWRQGRIHTIKKYCDKVFLLFPFEVDFYKKFNVPHEFVGHPLLDDLNPELLDQSLQSYARERYGIKASEKVLALMPGSRRSEVEFNFHIQLETARLLVKKYSDLRIMILVAPTLSKEYLQSKLEHFNSPYILIKEDPNQMISMADFVLAASGTATLMVGLLQKPMVIMYRMKWLTGVLAKMLVKGVPFFGIVNLIMNEEVVPERMQAEANPEELARLLQRYIEEPDYRLSTIAKLAQLQHRLGDHGATARIGEALAKYLT